MPDDARTFRIFVASPGDVQRERDALLGVINEVNRTVRALLPDTPIHLELVRWETHAYPSLGRPQAVINEQIGTYDIFVGVLWKRFGTPTGEADSGTEEEFELALQSWQKHGSPRICFYFNRGAIAPPRSAAEIEQLGKVAAFRERLQQLGLFWEYDGDGLFGATVRPHLTEVLGELLHPRPGPARQPRRRRGGGAGPVDVRPIPGQTVTLAAIGPADACYGQQDKYIGRTGVVIEARSDAGWLQGTFRFDEPLFDGDDRLYAFLQFRVEPADRSRRPTPASS